jgi:TIR domain
MARAEQGALAGAPTPGSDGAHDIFISYAREDRARAEPLVSALSARGWSVWWDDRLGGGQIWRQEIAKALSGAKCIIVLWSRTSAESPWVLDEAAEGRERGVLLPALLDDVEVPLGFRQIQAIDLADWNGGAPHPGFDHLVTGVARILGRPEIRPPAPSTTRRLLTMWGVPSAAVLPLPIALILYLIPLASTGIELEAQVSELSFLVPEQQDVTDLIVVSAFEGSGLRSIQIPRTRRRGEQVLNAPDSRGLAIQLLAGGAGSPGTITLAPLSVSPGTHVTLGADPRGYRMSFKGSALPLAANAQGSVQVTVAAGTAQPIDFGAPKPIGLEPDQGGVDLAISPVDRSRDLLATPLRVGSLSLFRIDERVEAQRTIVQIVSTIAAGTLRLEGLGGQSRVLRPGDGLRFGESRGELRALQLRDGALSLRFHGQVRRMQACSPGGCESWMPTPLEWLWARHKLPLLALAAASALGLIAASRRWRRRR